MVQRGTSRILTAIALTATLLSTAAPLTAQPLGAAASWRLSWDAVWTWARLGLGLHSNNGQNKAGRGDAGCGIDPNGICKSGITIDPDGVRSTDNDGGLGVDPNG